MPTANGNFVITSSANSLALDGKIADEPVCIALAKFRGGLWLFVVKGHKCRELIIT